jgi:phage terminase large subunit
VLGPKSPVRPFGGAHPEWYDYPNRSRVFVVGMDNSDKILSSERDVIYVNQAEELTLDDWEKLSTRCTGRAGNMPYAQMIGDCNPGAPSHWILQRRDAGALAFLESRHEDNPTLFEPTTGQITELGTRTMAVLNALTGVRKARLRQGKWVQAEGAIYEGWDRALHLIDRFEIPADWQRFRAVDFGYTAAFVCQWWAVDGDGRMYLYRELYMTHHTVKVHAGAIKELSEGERIQTTVCDHDAEDMATLRENGIATRPAEKAVSVGIQRVQERLKKAGDGKPRLFILRDSLVAVDEALRELKKPICTEQEIEGYVWANKATKEEPVKVDDHGCDAMRYAVMYLDRKGVAGILRHEPEPEPLGEPAFDLPLGRRPIPHVEPDLDAEAEPPAAPAPRSLFGAAMLEDG